MLRRVVAAPFIDKETDTVSRAEFIYSLSGTHDWYTPEEAEQIIQEALDNDIISSVEDGLSPRFSVDEVEPPPDPDTSALPSVGEESVMEVVVDRLVSNGYGKRGAVAEVNRTHKRLGNVNINAAAIVTSLHNDVTAADIVPVALEELKE